MVRRRAAQSVGLRVHRSVDPYHRTHDYGHHTNAFAFSGPLALKRPSPYYTTHSDCWFQTQIMRQSTPTKTRHQSTRENTRGQYYPPPLWRGKPARLEATAAPAVTLRSAHGSSRRAIISCAGLVPVARGKKRRKAAPCVTSEFSTITPCLCERQQSLLTVKYIGALRSTAGVTRKCFAISTLAWKSPTPRAADQMVFFLFFTPPSPYPLSFDSTIL